MKDNIKNSLMQITEQNDDVDTFLQILDLPDEKFDAIYPQMRDRFVELFDTPEFQNQVLQAAKSQTNVDIQAEKAYIEQLIKEINDDDTLSANKKELLTIFIENAALTTYELLEVPRQRIKVEVKKINDNAKIPEYAHPTDAGADIFAAEEITIEPRDTQMIRTGIQVAIPVGYEIQIRPRSGLSLKTGLRIANAPGTIDSDYRGEVAVIMTNIGQTARTIKVGDKIAQMVISEVPMIKWVETDNLDDTDRGEGGFGSTDKK